jgi:hypothetical protein
MTHYPVKSSVLFRILLWPASKPESEDQVEDANFLVLCCLFSSPPKTDDVGSGIDDELVHFLPLSPRPPLRTTETSLLLHAQQERLFPRKRSTDSGPPR